MIHGNIMHYAAMLTSFPGQGSVIECLVHKKGGLLAEAMSQQAPAGWRPSFCGSKIQALHSLSLPHAAQQLCWVAPAGRQDGAPSAHEEMRCPPRMSIPTCAVHIGAGPGGAGGGGGGVSGWSIVMMNCAVGSWPGHHEVAVFLVQFAAARAASLAPMQSRQVPDDCRWPVQSLAIAASHCGVAAGPTLSVVTPPAVLVFLIGTPSNSRDCTMNVVLSSKPIGPFGSKRSSVSDSACTRTLP